MKAASGPVLVPLEHDAHLLRPLLDRCETEPGSVLAARRDGDRFVDVTVKDVCESVRRVAKGFVASGVAPGDRVALMSHTRVEWMILDYAILAAGGVTVPIYDTSSVEQIRWIVSDSEAVMCVVETPTMLSDVEEIRADVATCREVLGIDAGAVEELEHRGAAVADSTIDERIATLDADSIATIIYTSGTTGRPKGCVLTHGNLRSNSAQVLDAIGAEVRPGDTGLLFLPLAHTLTKGNAQFDTEAGITIGFVSDIAHLPEELQMYRPTTMAAVPRIFEKVYNTAKNKANRERKGPIFDHAVDVAIRWSRERSAGRIWPWTAIEHRLFDRLVYGKIRQAFGGRLRLCFSGGGPLGERLTHFFAGVGVQIYEGYGLTETSPTLTLACPSAWKPGTVGRPIAGTSIKIADDGEILAKGPQVFRGYWHNEVATAEVFDDDGWFRTGDIGELDDEGYLRITGRKKELIVTAAGKNVAPAPLEDHLRAHELISQAVVVGDARPFIAALITIDSTALPDWASVHGRGDATFTDLLDSEELRTAIQHAVDQANASVSRAESIRTFVILPRDLTIQSGELTATLKVRRGVVEKVYADAIERIYAGDAVREPTAHATDEVTGEPRETVHTLRDGGRVLVRALRSSDGPEMAAQYEELSAEARRLRFFNAPEHLSGRLLDYLVDLDGQNRLALGARMLDEPGQPGVGVARYARDHEDPTAAEAAVTVLDAYCNRGIGTILLTSLVAEARANGITTFTASVMWENHMLLDSLRAYGASVVPDEPGVAAVSVELPREPKEFVGSALSRVLRTVAVRLGTARPDATGEEDGRLGHASSIER